MLSHTAEYPLFGGTVVVRRSTRRSLAAASAVLLVLLPGLAWRATLETPGESAIARASYPQGTVASLDRRLSHNSRYRAEVESGASVALGTPAAWTIQLSRRNLRRVAHARVIGRTWMPETGEQSAEPTAARYVGGGRYRLEGITFTRPGWWNVALIIDGPNGVDSVAFNVVLPPTTAASPR